MTRGAKKRQFSHFENANLEKNQPLFFRKVHEVPKFLTPIFRAPCSRPPLWYLKTAQPIRTARAAGQLAGAVYRTAFPPFSTFCFLSCPLVPLFLPLKKNFCKFFIKNIFEKKKSKILRKFFFEVNLRGRGDRQERGDGA